MEKVARYSYYLRYFAVLLILINIVESNVEYLVIFIGLLINDFLRLESFLGINLKRYTASLVFSVIGGAILIFLAHGYTQIYTYILIYETVLYTELKAGKFILALQVAAYFLIDMSYTTGSISTIFTAGFWRENAEDFAMVTLAMAFYILLLYFIRFQINERKKLQSLNAQLNESFKTLQEYSDRIEELTVTKERNRVAQEIHDSLGHSLTAVIMHLDFLEKVIEKDMQKSRELVLKAQELARSSMAEVRRAVYALKEVPKGGGLLDSLSELKNNLEINEAIEIHYEINGNMEEISPDLKNVLYRTIQESFTNGIKHGRATVFKVRLHREEEALNLEVNDNGHGCCAVVEGNGLLGIRGRTAALGGEVSYRSGIDKGFILTMIIPLKEK